MKKIKYDIKDLVIASKGKKRIEWAEKEMPVLRLIKERFEKEKPLRNIRLGACLHVTAETANLMIILKSAGAEIALCASNPLSTQDDVAASLVRDFEIPVFAVKGETSIQYFQHLNAVLDTHPQITMDDGADLVALLHTERKNQINEIIGSSEETTTGVIRLKAMEKEGTLALPVLAVNDSDTKHLFDNRFGTGQSTIDGILRATNILIAGKIFVVCGFGFCGRGIAERAKAMGARVVVCETDPVKALEAVMMGYEVEKLETVISKSDLIVTVTGDKHVVSKAHFEKAKDGVILANSGHFNVEIDVEFLNKTAKRKLEVRKFVDEYLLEFPNGKTKKIYLLAEGRLANLACAEGHPASVMDMSFANQALAAEWFLKNRKKLEKKVYRLPFEMDQEIARLKLKSMNIENDELTAEQRKYLNTWTEGT